MLADVLLLVSELVTNAVRHGGTEASNEIVVRVALGGCVRVEVVDSGPTFVASPRSEYDSAPSGWGLYLLDSVAREWGIDPDVNGKKVWFELDAA